MSNKKSNSNRLSGIWLAVLLLCILVLASAALLGSFIKRYVEQEKNVISVMADANAVRNEYDDRDLPVGTVPDFEGFDDEVKWETLTSVDLFKNTYTDAEGNVTVQSASGEKVIAPGTTNDYNFTLKNTGNVSLDYTLNLEGVFTLSDQHLPFYVRLRRGETWVSGNEQEWVHVNLLEEVVEQGTLPKGESVSYTFEWQWPYEADEENDRLISDLKDTLISADMNDTKLGNIAIDVSADFRLNITTTAVVTPGAIPVFNDNVAVASELGFVTLMSGLILASGIWLILIVFRRKIYFTGIIVPALGNEAALGKVKSEISMGRFIFPKARFGKRTLQVENAKLVIRFKSRKVEEGVRFARNGEKTIIVVGRKIRAVELHFLNAGVNMNINTVIWAAIDKKHNVYTPAGIVPPIEKRNTTPNGLCIDENGKLFIRAV